MKFVLNIFIVALLFASCSGNAEKKTNQVSDSTKSCSAKPIKDPNNPKPMALMMRHMADNADSMKAELLRGETPDSVAFPFVRFYLVEPTDSSVLEPKFFENARLFQQAYYDFFRTKEHKKENFNAVIGKCINCHESYCNGPLKRIRKIVIDI
ncbi:MAG: hypothetical protein WCO54_10655 [Bacteroidota bacterium]